MTTIKKNARKIKALEKSISRTAGEVIGAIGHTLVEGKEKITEVAHAIAEKLAPEKKQVVKKAKKAAKTIAKKTSKGAVKKAATKVIKKAAKKTASKKKALVKSAKKAIAKKK